MTEGDVQAELEEAQSALTDIAQVLGIDRPDARPRELAAYVIDEVRRLQELAEYLED